MRISCLAAILFLLAVAPLHAESVGTAFTYQGLLEKPAGTLVQDVCAFSFSLCDADSGPCNPATVSSHAAVSVSFGIFTVPDVDFGPGSITGEARWMEIAVKCSGDADFAMLSPRVELRPAPHALALPGLYTQQNGTSPNIIGGNEENSVTPGVVGSTIAGGGATGSHTSDYGTFSISPNRVTDDFGSIGGGCTNIAGNDAAGTNDQPWATVGGGENNIASGFVSTVGGGQSNRAVRAAATVGGGQNNQAQEFYTTVAGGVNNTAALLSSTVSGGNGNTAGGDYSTVPGGRDNQANGAYSLAAGRRAKIAANHDGALVWADSDDADFTSTGPNQFLVRASGGVGIGTNSPQAQLDVNGVTRVVSLEIVGNPQAPATIVAWGNNSWGQTDVQTGEYIAMAAGDAHSLALRSNGSVVGWGHNGAGQLNIPPHTFIAIAAGASHSLAIRDNGTLAGWGFNQDGQTSAPSGTFVAITAGFGHSLAIRSDGTLAGWGSNDFGETGVPSGTFTSIAARAYHSLGLRTDGTLSGWGSNFEGESDVPLGSFIAVAAGERHGIAIRTDGTLVGWGYNAFGQIDVPNGSFLAVAAGDNHSLAIRSDGSLIAWGNNNFDLSKVPAGSYSAIAAGALHSMALAMVQSSANALLFLSSDSATKLGTNTWTIFSDRRLKKDITPLDGALDRLLQLQGVTFHWRDPASQGGITGLQMGLIADEVQRVFPQWVGRDPKGYQTLTVGGFEALTAEAMRELRAEKDRQLSEKDCEIESLGSEVQDLKSEISELKEMVRDLQKGNMAARQEGNDVAGQQRDEKGGGE